MGASRFQSLMDQGQPLNGVLVLDAHVHLFSPAADFIAVADRLGMDKMCLGVYFVTGGGEREALQAIRDHPDYFLGFIMGVNPWYPDEIETRLDDLFAQGCITLGEQGPSYYNYPISGPNYIPVWEYARRKGCFVGVHSDHNNNPTAAPLEVAKVAKRFPDVPTGIVHCGVDWASGVDETIEAARQCDNIFVEISSVHARYGALERMIAQIGADRIVFGTDGGVIHFCSDLANLVYARGVSDADKEKILGLNLARLLNCSPDELRRKSKWPPHATQEERS